MSCPVCLEEKECIYAPICHHGVCKDCIVEICQPKPLYRHYTSGGVLHVKSNTYNIKVNIPRGYKIVDFKELNKSKEYISVDGNSTAKFLSKATVNGNVLNINIIEYYKELRYNKKRYQECVCLERCI